ALVALAVEVSVVKSSAGRVVTRPRREAGRAGGLVDGSVGFEHEDLRAGVRGIRRCEDRLDLAVTVEVGRGEAARLRAVTPRARARAAPAGLQREARARPRI